MEPNKMDAEFKEKLEQRTIQPSEMAWDRLDAMLSVAENKKPKKNRSWMYMAAAFLVFLLVGVLFLNQEKNADGTENNSNTVVTTKEQPKQPENSVEPQTNIAPATNTEAVAVEAGTKGTSKKINTPAINNTSLVTTEVQQAQEVAVNEKPAPANASPLVSDAESLLASAATGETAKKKPTVKVDPNSLLSTVEGEINESYRSAVFQKAVKKLNVVKSAVANRNYE